MITRGAWASPVTTVVAPIYDDGYITPVATERFNNWAFWTPYNIWATSQISTRHCKKEKLYAIKVPTYSNSTHSPRNAGVWLSKKPTYSIYNRNEVSHLAQRKELAS